MTLRQCNPVMAGLRPLVERFRSRTTDFGRIATRYDARAHNFASDIALLAVITG